VDACGRGFSVTIVALSVPVLLVQVGDDHPVFRLPIVFIAPDVHFKTTNGRAPKNSDRYSSGGLAAGITF